MTGNGRILLWVALGSALGGCLRQLSGDAFALAGADTFPWPTLFVNAVGSFAIGWFAAATGPGTRAAITTNTRQFVMAGVLGGYTTFSIFSLETLGLIEAGRIAATLGNMAGTITICLAAVAIGHILGLRRRWR